MTEHPNPHDAPLLLPRPRRVEFIGGPASTALLAVRAEKGVNLRYRGPEAYQVRLEPRGAIIQARGDQGAAHAEATLMQIRRQYGDHCPAMVIDDGPAFATRGVMLDVSRNRIPTMDQLFQTVELLAKLKFNHLQLYTEHTFAYAGHEEIWRDYSPLTPDEIRDLDDLCQRRGIELAANQNCFGHLSHWLRHPNYAHLAETHGEWIFENGPERFTRSGPFSLCPTDPTSLEFVKGLLTQLLPCFSSSLVNIGCDETFDVGWGRSKTAVEERGRAAVYFDFVRRIADVVRREGKRPMFWADIALSDPASIPLIPEDMIGLAWGYEADAPFAEWCTRLRGAGREVWVCPGTSSWRSITGRTSERSANLAVAARDGVMCGAAGVLVTDWGDGGHHQQWPVSLIALAEAAEAAWSGNTSGYDARAAGLHVFQDSSGAIGAWLDELGDADLPLRRIGGRRAATDPPCHLRNASVLFNDLFLPIGPGGDERLRTGIFGVPRAVFEECLERLEDLATRRPRLADALMESELDHTLRVARFAARRAIWRRSGTPAAERRALLDELLGIIDEHRTLWLARSRKGGLKDSCAHYERVAEELK